MFKGLVKRYMIVDDSWTPRTIMNYDARGQTGKTIIDYNEELEQVQSEW